jgi:hypothetical protein
MSNPKRVLFIGNSITRHEPAPDIGWYGSWGMAASCEKNDYAHVIISKFEEAGLPIEYKIKNIADFERAFWEYDLNYYKELRDFEADIIIMRITENVSEEEAASRGFGKYYEELINYLNLSGNAQVICSNGFGEHEVVNRQIKEVADKYNYPLADLSQLWYDDSNKALNEFEHEGVRSHPSDTGMRRIAEIIFRHIVI